MPVDRVFLLAQSQRDAVAALSPVQQVLGISQSFVFLHYILEQGVPGEEAGRSSCRGFESAAASAANCRCGGSKRRWTEHSGTVSIAETAEPCYCMKE